MYECTICGKIYATLRSFNGHVSSHSLLYLESMAELGKQKRLINEQKYYTNPKKCKHCLKSISYDRRECSYCDRACANKHLGHTKRQIYIECAICGLKKKNFTSTRKRQCCSRECSIEHKKIKYLQNWKDGLEDGMSGSAGISSYIRAYLFEKCKNKCCKCGWAEKNQTTGKIPLQVNHIDGNYKNNKEENLELICPNCHSLTSNYGSLNIGNGREYRYVK